MEFGEPVAFTLKADIPMFIWLAGCVDGVSTGRFYSPADIRGSAFGAPSPAIALRAAVLQNLLERTVLAFGGHPTLAALPRGTEPVLIPLLRPVSGRPDGLRFRLCQRRVRPSFRYGTYRRNDHCKLWIARWTGLCWSLTIVACMNDRCPSGRGGGLTP